MCTLIEVLGELTSIGLGSCRNGLECRGGIHRMLQGYRESAGLGTCPSLVVRASRSGPLVREFLATLIVVISLQTCSSSGKTY